MKVKFKKSFARDLKKRSNDRKLSAKVKRIIGQVDEAENAHQIPNLKKLKAQGNYYRIRSRDYRLGLIIEGGTATFVRVLHRSEIYRYFP
ncbi:MAG: type II toxin-antitoxin system RelE/ParE family toxin [Deltaproteobacteria bacterium]|nr:MAG: type II toxin-antitoxin system RelE/ParE family toxin [Deltaproteobacteria bacterium]